METVILGNSDLRVSRLGFGCWQLGGHGWQENNQSAIIDAINSALEAGLNFFDTADVYGLGMSETLLGETLAKHPLGKQAVISSKFGVRRNGGETFYDNSREWLQESIDASLKRLKRETIDLYQIHRHDGKRPLSDTFEDLENLRAQGKIRWYGISNIDPANLDMKNLPEGLVSFTLEYSLIKRGLEQAIISGQKDAGLGFISWGSLSQGLLSGKYNRQSVFAEGDIRSRDDSLFAAKNWDYYEPVLAALKEIATRNNKDMAQAALRWVLDSHPHSIALTGIKNRQQINDNIGALGWNLSADDIALLNNISARR
jgi:aryl-alcohol dehydrogenase-like predicted oxidoreductase